MSPPFVSVVIPARNEEGDIERCLDHVLVQDYPHDRLEVVVVDGGSVDDTAATAREVLQASTVTWKVVDNPVGTTPSNLNAALEVAGGEIICRVDARSFIPPGYVRRCVEVLEQRTDIAVVGGAQVAHSPGRTIVERGIARALNNRLVMGGARYRSGATSGPDETVYLGAFRTVQLRAERGWDDRLYTNQDFDLNRRMRKFGLVWFDDSIPVEYRPRSDLPSLATQYHRFGRAKVRYWRDAGDAPLLRQRRILTGVALAGSAGIATILVSSSKFRAAAAVLGAAAMTTLAVDHVGSEVPAPAGERLAASLAITVVGSAWSSGVAFAAATGR